MNDVLALLLFVGGMVGGILLAVYLCLLPPRLFLRDQRWLTETEFREAAPAKAWCRHLPVVAGVAGFVLHVTGFLIVRATCRNAAVLMLGFLPLFFLWIYVPVGVVELMAGVSVLVPVGRHAGGAQFIVARQAVRAGALRLFFTAVVFAAYLTAAYW